MNWAALWTSLQLATVTSALLLLLAVPLAYWLAFSKRRWRYLIEALVALPLVLPPTVLGFYVLIGLGPRTPLGAAFERVVGHPLPFTFEGLVVASVIYSMPFAVQPVASAFAAVDRRLLEASWLLGVSSFGTFTRVIAPQSFRGIVTGAVMSFAHTIGEFGVVLMVGGDIDGVTRTVSIDIYDQVQALNYSSAHQTALLLVIFSFVVLSGVYALNRGGGSLWEILSTRTRRLS
jgi:molybdate transport system permease protein